MKKLTNKGQSLVIFVLLLPVIIVVIAFIIDYGMLNVSKNKLDSTNKILVNYGMKNIKDVTNEKIVNLIRLNDSDISKYDIKIDNENKEIKITLYKSINSFSYKIIKKDEYEIKSVYEGYIKNNKIIIERGN